MTFWASVGLLVTSAAQGTAASAQANASGPVVRTQSGAVEGTYRRQAAEFRGIPFAAPPIGALRWRPPVAPQPWQGTRQAKAFGPTCAQISVMGGFGGPANENEDCLYLNVTAPRTALTGRAKLPVFVWVYGGGYINGSSSDYDAYKLAVRGRAVIVTLNYRLNLFGFLAHPALDRGGQPFGNYAMLDQQLALKWVQANIAEFGGDPGNVTLGGESAGGSSTGVQMTSPLARGLFHKAIIQSAGSYLTAIPLEQARAKGVAFAKAAGCGEGDDEATATCLRNLPASAIVRLAGTSSAPSSLIVQGAIRDGQIVTSGASSAFAEGRFSRVPVLNGTNRDEGGFFTGLEMYGTGTPPWNSVTQESTARMVRAVYGAKAEAILEAYPADRYRTAQLRSNAIQSDAFVCKSQHATELLAGKVPLYTYEFRDRTAPSLFPDMPGFEPLAYHASEIQYLFPGFRGGMGLQRPLNARQQRLSDKMVTAWTNFMRSGNPGGNGVGTWPAFAAPTGVHMGLDLAGFAPISDADFVKAHQCDFWKGVLTYN